MVGLYGVLQMAVCVPVWALNILASVGDRLESDRRESGNMSIQVEISA